MDEVVHVPIADLTLDPANARKGSVPTIAASLKEFGQHRPAVVQRSTGRVIAGNHLVMAAESLGWDTVAVFYVDDDDLTATRRGIADNAVGDQATWDEDALAKLVLDAGTDIPGLDDSFLEKLLADVNEESEAPQYPITAQAGEHYSYVLLVADNIVDEAFLETVFELRRELSYKSSAVKVSRVVTVRQFRDLIPKLMNAAAVDVAQAREGTDES